MSSPQQCVYTTSIIRLHTLRPHTGCSFHAESLLRASSTRSDRRWCLRASRPYCWQACGTRISRPSACGGLATNIALFIGSGEGNPHELLLANSEVPKCVCSTCLLGRQKSWGNFRKKRYSAIHDEHHRLQGEMPQQDVRIGQ